MKHARILCAALLLSASVLPLGAADLDMVVMLDKSASMFPYFDDLRSYLIQDLLTAKLHAGDTFHLLSFDIAPEEELSLDMGSAEASIMALGRLRLLEALGRYTDLIAALTYLDRYTKGLPEKNPKTIILVTDGVHDPPPGSPNRKSAEEVRAEIQRITDSMKKSGWTIHILKVPPKPIPGEEGLTSFLPDIAEALDVPIIPYLDGDGPHVTGELTGFPTLIFPPAFGTVGLRFNAPFRVMNFKSEPLLVKLSGVASEDMELLERAVSITVPPRGESRLDVPIALPSSLEKGAYEKNVTLSFEDDIRISPTEGILRFTYSGAAGIVLPRVNALTFLYVAVGIVAVVLLVLLVLYLRRRLQEIPAPKGTEAATKASATPDAGERRQRTAPGRHLVPLMGEEPDREAAQRAVPGKPTMETLKRSLPRMRAVDPNLPRMIEMRVSEQNSHIGFRNIHRIPAGGSRAVGGGFSAYLVFLVPIPRKIAEIRNEGGRYTFIPLRGEFFPGLSGPVADCLGVDIPMATPRLSFTIRFRPWVSPLEEINALMRMSRS